MKLAFLARTSISTLLLFAFAAPAFGDYAVLYSSGPHGSDTPVNPAGQPLIMNGNIYFVGVDGGTEGSGTVSAFNIASGTVTTLHAFSSADSYLAYGALAVSGNVFYGTTNGLLSGGVIYSLNTDGSDYQVLHRFQGSDGTNPYSGVAVSGGVAYGVTSIGGSSVAGTGTVYSINLNGTGYQVLEDFDYSIGRNTGFGTVTVSGDTAFGFTHSSIFKMSTNGTDFQLLYSAGKDGNLGGFETTLSLIGNTLYGMAAGGGANNGGALFRMNTDGTDVTDLHDFSSTADDGSNPADSLLVEGSKIYGMTTAGGSAGHGIVFSSNLDGSDYTILHTFLDGPDDGALPRGSLALDGNTLYGFTLRGGANDTGTIFSITVPEPASLALLLFAGPAFLMRRTKRSR